MDVEVGVPNRFNTRDAIAYAAIAIPLLWAGVGYIGRDLWWDEILSLLNYSLQDLRDSLTHLKSTNNHIFFNLVNNLFTRLIRERDFYALMDQVHLLRALQFVFASVTTIYTVAAARRFFGFTTAFCAGVVLVTTLPFLNFIMQLRGYSLSMMFVAMTLYHVWAYEERLRIRDLAVASISVFCLVYTVLSNIYFVLALFLCVSTAWLLNTRRVRSGGKSPRVGRAYRADAHARVVGVIAGAMLLIALAYMPVWSDFLQVHARYLSDPPPYRTYVLLERLPTIVHHLLSFRYALAIPFVAGCVMLLVGERGKVANSSAHRRGRFCQLAILFVSPFVVSFLRNEQAYARTFVYLAPVFALCLAVGIGFLVERMAPSRNWARVLSVAMYGYCVGTLIAGDHFVQQRLRQNLIVGRRDQNIMYNYYQSKLYQPKADTARYAEAMRFAPRPVIGFDDIDNLALSHYFNRVNVPYYTVNIQELDAEVGGRGTHVATFQKTNGRNHSPPLSYTKLELEAPDDVEGRGFHVLYSALKQKGVITGRHPGFYVNTAFPDKFALMLRRTYPGFKFDRFNEEIGYTNLFAIEEPDHAGSFQAR